MAEKQTKTKEETVVEEPTMTSVPAVSATTAVSTERRSFIPENDVSGTEEIGLNDIRLPRLAIAQGPSPQVSPDDSSFIKGLTLIDMFNDLTSEIYGRGPLTFIPVLREVHLIEYDPEQRGVPLDRNVPPGDPRTMWTKDENGKGVPPRATRYVDFVVLLIREDRPEPEAVVLSIKCSNKFQTRAAERLSGFIKFQATPIYGAYKTVATKSEKNDKGTFGVFVINNGKRLDAPEQTDAEWKRSSALFLYAQKFYASLKGKNIIVSREVGVDDFDTEAMDAETAAQTAPRM